MKINIEVSCGELIDKLTILSIKQEKIIDVQKLKNISKETFYLESTAEKLTNFDEKAYESFYGKLRDVNEKLWNIEDEIRKLEMKKDFSKKFIKLARDVYITNDERFDIKNRINIHFQSDVKEEKDYEKYE
ncbi:DUF6165 family protein [Acidimicrobiia bacterium]|nr:DUF6165 family protein [Candidatus Actinomarina sp.]MDA9844814.1 DUF6165 family protein [Acidimicrobiia bacterium]|tara:strand:- start:470 stop:862 length:393 start_codon:yes stop_codon:yes gene_type:complete